MVMRRGLRAVAVVALCGLVSTPITKGADSGAGGGRTEAKAPVATVRGLVTDQAGAPLKDAKVQVYGIEVLRDGKWERAFFSGVMPFYATDKNGRFAIPFHSKTNRFDVWFDKFTFAPAFMQGISANTPDIKIALERGQPVTGTVARMVNGQERPVPGATVELKMPTWDLWYQQRTHTGHDGQYTLYAGPPLLGSQWQVVFLEERVPIDVELDKPIPSVDFSVEVVAKKRDANATPSRINSRKEQPK